MVIPLYNTAMGIPLYNTAMGIPLYIPLPWLYPCITLPRVYPCITLPWLYPCLPLYCVHVRYVPQEAYRNPPADKRPIVSDSNHFPLSELNTVFTPPAHPTVISFLNMCFLSPFLHVAYNPCAAFVAFLFLHKLLKLCRG